MSDNQWWFLDLAAVIAIAGVLTLAIFSGAAGVVRTVIAIPLVLFLPGYALVSVLFPTEPNIEYQAFDEEKTGLGNPLLATGGLETIERAVLSGIFSIALVSTVTLFASVTPRGIALEPVLSGLALVTVVLSLIAIGIRYRYSPDQRYAPSLSSPFFTRVRPGVYGRPDPRPYNVAIVIGLVLLIASGGFALANPPAHDGFTEFSVDTEPVSGDTETMYESTYTAGETAELQTSITNREHGEREYTTVVLLERVSYGNDSVTVHETTELDRRSTTVADGETREQTLEITPTMRGDDLRLTLLLYEGEPPADPTAENAYRSIHLPIRVE